MNMKGLRISLLAVALYPMIGCGPATQEAEEPVAEEAEEPAIPPTQEAEVYSYPDGYPEGTVAAYLEADGRFDTYLEITDQIVYETAPPLLVNTNYAWTLFVPTDEAFAALPPDLLEQLTQDQGLGEIMMHHHSFDKPRFSDDFGLLPSWPTITNQAPVTIEIEGDQIWYDGALVIERDIQVGDSVIDVLDAVTGVDLLTGPPPCVLKECDEE